MKADQASRTAQYMALFRALETTRPASKRLFNDPLAVHFLPVSLALVARLGKMPWLRGGIESYIDRRWPGARTSGIARTRLIDDWLQTALENGTRQVVILGAGFDSRAYRLDRLKEIRVFEVDHPATLKTKRQLVKKYAGSLPGHVEYIPVDFNRQSLPGVMVASGFDPAQPAFFIWEGVTNYLTAGAVAATLDFIGGCASGSQLAFTYVHRGVLDGSFRFEGAEEIAKLLQKAGEDWTFGLDPAALAGYLAGHKLKLLKDCGSVEYRAAYLGKRENNLRGYEFYRAALVGSQKPEVRGQ